MVAVEAGPGAQEDIVHSQDASHELLEKGDCGVGNVFAHMQDSLPAPGVDKDV